MVTCNGAYTYTIMPNVYYAVNCAQCSNWKNKCREIQQSNKIKSVPIFPYTIL